MNMKTQMDKLVGYKEGGTANAFDILQGVYDSLGLEIEQPSKSPLSFLRAVPIKSPKQIIKGWGENFLAMNKLSDASFGGWEGIDAVAVAEQAAGFEHSGIWNVDGRIFTILHSPLNGELTVVPQDSHNTDALGRQIMPLSFNQIITKGERISSTPEQSSSKEPLSTQRAQEQQAYAEAEAQRQSEAEAQRQSEAEAQSYVEVEQAKAAEAQALAEAQAKAEAQQKSLTKLGAPTALGLTGGGSGLSAGQLGQSGAGGTGPYSGTGGARASGGLVQTMYDGGVVRMVDGGTAKDVAYTAASVTPVLGEVIAAKEIWDAYNKEGGPDYKAMGIAALGLIPYLGDAAKLGVKASKTTDMKDMKEWIEKLKELEWKRRKVKQPSRATVTKPKTMYDGGLV
jgi:hypothetical protein